MRAAPQLVHQTRSGLLPRHEAANGRTNILGAGRAVPNP